MTTNVKDRSQQTGMARVARLSIALTFFSFILIGANDGGLGVLIPSIRVHYHIDNVTISFIFLASTAGYIFSSLICGILVEKLGMRRFLILGVTDYIICALCYSLQPAFPLLLIAALFLGAGVGSIDAGMNSYLASLPNNTRLLNYLHAFYGAGAWLGPFVGTALLAAQFSWNSVYLVWGGLALVVVIGLLSIFRVQENSSNTPVENKTVRPQENILLATLKLRVVWIAGILFVIYTGVEVSIGNWSFSFLLSERHTSELLSGWMISGYWLGLTMGRIVLGHIAGRIGSGRLVSYSIPGVAVGILLMWLSPSPITTAIGLFIMGFCLGPIFPTVIAMMSTLVSARLLPGAVGFLTSSANIGAALLSWLAGSLIQRIGPLSLWPFEIVMIAIMLCVWSFLTRQPAAA